jgi:hypothetical protein
MKNLQDLIKHGIMMIQKLEENGEMSLKRSLMIWISNKFGRSLRIVRHNGMHKHCAPMYGVYIF